MKVTVHISSYASGAVQYCEHFPSLKAAKEHFLEQINDWLDGIGSEGRPDAIMDVYPYTPEDNNWMSHNDYPAKRYSVGRKRHGKYTLREECI